MRREAPAFGGGITLRAEDAAPGTFSDALVDVLAELGVEYVFGVIGGGIAPWCRSVSESALRFVHCRHENGAAFAAIEASLASGRLTVVATTTGPGLANTFTGMVAARAEGARVLFVSGCTAASQRGRGAFQETTASGAYAGLFASGPLFHHAQLLEHPAELEVLASRLASGIARPHGFVAHVGLPLAVQSAPASRRTELRVTAALAPQADPQTVERVAEELASEPFVIWAGFGARQAATSLLELAEQSGAHVMTSPRGKGAIPEDHPLSLGVTGLGGHSGVEAHLKKERPARALVLGTRLGEMTSFWSPDLLPRQGLIHVDLDESAFGAAYPSARTLGVKAEIGAFVRQLLAYFGHAGRPSSRLVERPRAAMPAPRPAGRVRPSYLMAAVQRHLVEESALPLLSEAGNAFVLGSHFLRFREPGRYRSSTSFGSMGHAAGGVLGAALAHGKAVALVGDGALLMLNELNTAAQYGIEAIWVVLNDAAYGMIAHGMRSLGWKPFDVDFPEVDFAAIANAMGVRAARVTREAELADALKLALAAEGPFLIDVLLDASESPPQNRRNQTLADQGTLRREVTP